MYEEEVIHFGKLLPKQSEMVLKHLTLVTLTLVTPILIGFISYPGSMCGPSLKRWVKGLWSYWSETKRLQTHGPTDMCKAICPLFFEGGHKNWLIYQKAALGSVGRVTIMMLKWFHKLLYSENVYLCFKIFTFIYFTHYFYHCASQIKYNFVL